MQKFLAILFCVFLAGGNFVYATDENVESVKDALNGALGLPSKSPMFIVKVRRQVLPLKKKQVAPGEKTQTPKLVVDEEKKKTLVKRRTPLISSDEFEQLLKLLYSLCSNQGAPICPIGCILPSEKNIKVTTDNVASVDALCGDLAAYRAKINGACTLVVFNEALFSQDPPLESSQKKFILDQLKILSSSSPNTVFYPNFLFTEMRGNTRKQVANALKEMENNSVYREGESCMRVNFMEFDHYATHPFINSKTKTMGIFKGKPTDEVCQVRYLLNETFAVHSGEVLTAYKKFTYFDEHNETLNNGSLYDFGEGTDIATDVSEDQKKLQAALLENISTETCFDLACGVRYQNEWTNLTEPSKLHIIPSNTIRTFGRKIDDNISCLPLGVGIINADSYLDQRPDGIPYCKAYQRPKLHDNDVDNEINMIAYLTDADNKSYEAVIGDSRYIITICKI